jgi:hypothetical protein
MVAGPRNAHQRRLPRHARHLARHIMRRGTAYHRASVLVQQADSMVHDISRGAAPALRQPVLTDEALGQRVRIGNDTRDLLRRLLASRNLRVQQQLAREIRHSIIRRISIHAARSDRLRGARANVRRAARATRRAPSQVATRARERSKVPPRVAPLAPARVITPAGHPVAPMTAPPARTRRVVRWGPSRPRARRA